MKKLFKGTLPTIAILLVAVMSLTTFTYAWFTGSATAEVDVVDVGVIDVDGLVISANGWNGTWGSKMTPLYSTYTLNDDHTYDKSKFRSILQDVSCTGVLNKPDSNTMATLNFFHATYDPDWDVLRKSDACTSVNDNDKTFANWIQFDIYVKNEGEKKKTVTFDGSSISSDFMSKAIARIAIVQQGVGSASQGAHDYTEPTITYKGETIDYRKVLGIWEPRADNHTAEGIAWLQFNDQADYTSKQASYIAVNQAFSDKIVNVATGDEFTLYNTVLELLNLAENAAPTSANVPTTDGNAAAAGNQYYVFTPDFDVAAGEHFRVLEFSDFYKTAKISDIMDSDGKLKASLGYDVFYGEDIKENAPATAKFGDETTYYYYDNGAKNYVAITEATRGDYFYAADYADEAKRDLIINTKKVFIDSEGGKKAYSKVAEGEYIYDDREYIRLATVGGSSADVEVYTKATQLSDASNERYMKAPEKIVASKGDQLDFEKDKTEITFELDADQIVKLTVYIWLEGQDCDCTNYVAGSEFKVDLKLSAKPEETPAA